MTTPAAADELVVVRCQLGERAAFDELVERWHHPVWSFVHEMVGDPDRTDDLTQEVWCRVVRGLPRLAAPGRFAAWLFTLARRALYDERRQGYREVDTDPLTSTGAPGPATLTDNFGRLLDRLQIESAVAELAPREREVIALFRLADLPLADVAEILAVPPGTVKSRPHRARQQLSGHPSRPVDGPMNDVPSDRPAHIGPGRSNEQILAVLDRELSRSSRLRCVAVGLTSLVLTAVTGVLWATEPSLPRRTHGAFAGIVVLGIAWMAVGAYVLTWRQPLYAADRVLATGLTVVASSAVGIATTILAGVRGGVLPALAAGGVAVAYVATSTVLHLAARRRRDALLTHRRESAQAT